MADEQFLRKATLIVSADEVGIDLSEMRFRFRIQQSDEESPNTATIRIYNLSKDTVKRITGMGAVEFTRVVLQAGYENNFGVIFDGTIKQFGRGKENATDTYLDIFAAHGDEEYNFGVVNSTLAAGSTHDERVKAISSQMGLGVPDNVPGTTGGVLPRGKVLWGMGRSLMRSEAATQGASWSIQDGKVSIVPLKGYLPGEAVKLNSASGMIGIPEQTDQGIRARKLLDPKLRIGGLVQINNGDINQVSAQTSQQLPMGQIPYNQRAGLQFLADVSSDGFYKLYVVEHHGDTRGHDWYSDLVCLAVDMSSDKVIANG